MPSAISARPRPTTAGLRGGSELQQSYDLAVAGQYHDHVERASCNLTCACYWRRDYQSALGFIERGVAYADALHLSHWEAYLRGWRAMVWLDQGDWNRAEEEAQEICSRSYAAEMYRFPALIALARLRIRRGDQDAEIPFEAARGLAAAMAEPQRAVYIAMLAAEEAWQLNAAAAPEEAAAAGDPCGGLAAARGLHDRAAAQFPLGGGGCGAVALHAR